MYGGPERKKRNTKPGTRAFGGVCRIEFNTLDSTLLDAAKFRQVPGHTLSDVHWIRDKIAASKRKGIWMGGLVPLAWDVQHKVLGFP